MPRLSVVAPSLHLANLVEIPINDRKMSYGWTCSAVDCDAGLAGHRDRPEARAYAGQHEAHRATSTFAPGSLVVCVGPAGSGKSHFAGAFPYHWVVSLDEMRERLCGDGGNQEVTPQAVHIQNSLVASRMEYGQTTVVDATNVEADKRASLVALARKHQRNLAAVLFQTDLDTCAELNAQRTGSRQVPLSTLVWQHGQTPTPQQLADEGFTDIHTVRLQSS